MYKNKIKEIRKEIKEANKNLNEKLVGVMKGTIVRFNASKIFKECF